MSKLEVLTTEEDAVWLEALERSVQYDFYHLPQYHALAEAQGEGEARLFLYTEGEYTIALPLLLRSLDEFMLGTSFDTGWRDATSVYGYAGPVCSHAEIPAVVVGNFQSALEKRLRELRVVSVFSRLNPFVSQRPVLAGLGECRACSRTVSIDLTLPTEVQRSQIRSGNKHRINRLRREGMTCIQDDRSGSHLQDFVRIYHETMRRVGASAGYFFSPEYFARLRTALGSRLHLFMCQWEGRVVCAGLFVACREIVQYHLGGTLDDALNLSPMHLLLDEVRLWATEQGLRALHLGGGATARPDDSLLHFKKGFSDRTHEFAVWRWVVQPSIEQELCLQHDLNIERRALRRLHADYFPAYRCPTAAAPRECEVTA